MVGTALGHDPLLGSVQCWASWNSTQGLCGAGGQEHVEPTGALCGRYRDAVSLDPSKYSDAIEMYEQTPAEIVLDLDTTDDPLHGQQEGTSFTGTTEATLPAAVHLLRAASAGGEAAHGGCGQRGRGNRNGLAPKTKSLPVNNSLHCP